MKTRKKLLLVLLVLMAFALAACSNNNVSNDDDNRPGFNDDNQNPWEEGNTEEGTNAEVENNQNEIEDITPTYNSITEAVDSMEKSITDDQKNDALPTEYNSGVYEIKEAGNYYFEGELTSAITVSKNAGKVHIYLNNVSLTVEDASAISSKAGAYVTITVLGTNTLSNTLGANEKDKHAIDSKENLVINGSGVLNINSTKSAIASDKTFIGLGATINASAVKHVVTADSIYIDGSIINAISCGKDVLHAESDYDEVEEAPTFNYALGFVYINSGEINTTNVLGDGIQADSFVYIKGGISIGDNSTIGAGSVVINDIPNNCIALGNPAKVFKKFNIVHNERIKNPNDKRSEKEISLNEELYFTGDEELTNDRIKSFKNNLIYNSLSPDKINERKNILKNHLGNIKNDNFEIDNYFNIDYGIILK